MPDDQYTHPTLGTFEKNPDLDEFSRELQIDEELLILTLVPGDADCDAAAEFASALLDDLQANIEAARQTIAFDLLPEFNSHQKSRGAAEWTRAGFAEKLELVELFAGEDWAVLDFELDVEPDDDSEPPMFRVGYGDGEFAEAESLDE